MEVFEQNIEYSNSNIQVISEVVLCGIVNN